MPRKKKDTNNSQPPQGPTCACDTCICTCTCTYHQTIFNARRGLFKPAPLVGATGFTGAALLILVFIENVEYGIPFALILAGVWLGTFGFFHCLEGCSNLLGTSPNANTAVPRTPTSSH